MTSPARYLFFSVSYSLAHGNLVSSKICQPGKSFLFFKKPSLLNTCLIKKSKKGCRKHPRVGWNFSKVNKILKKWEKRNQNSQILKLREILDWIGYWLNGSWDNTDRNFDSDGQLPNFYMGASERLLEGSRKFGMFKKLQKYSNKFWIFQENDDESPNTNHKG
jgi:hypothetical protein